VEFFPSRAVALQIGGFAVHWYGIMYLLAFLLAYAMVPRLQRFRGIALSADDWSAIVSWGVLGVLIGGRLGFVLLYEPSYFLVHPLEIPAVWHGGMSSHGGFIGILLTLWWAARRHGVPFLALLDLIVVPAAIGLAFGRIGNFINQELYGIPTALPWGIAIPGIEGLRHPTQIYAVFKDLCIAALCFAVLRRNRSAGSAVAVFCMLYGVLRFLLEFLRIQPYPLVSFGVISLSRGQLFSVPLLLFGIALWLLLQRQAHPRGRTSGGGSGSSRTS